jgi:putative flavoprotein involved in K+ transport
VGAYDRKVSELASPKAKFSGKPHISGTKGGHTINLHQFARDGVTLLGRLAGIENGIVKLADDLHKNLAAADHAEAEFVGSVDAFVARTGMIVPEEQLVVLRDGFAQPILTELDLAAAGIANVIWGTGYAFDFSMVKLPVLDGDGFPVQARGVTAYPGLFFVGLPWLYTAKSGLIYGVGEDASYVTERIAERDHPRKGLPAMPAARPAASRKEAPRATRLADRVAALIWSSVLSLALEGFAAYAAGAYPAALAEPPHQADAAVAQENTPSTG